MNGCDRHTHNVSKHAARYSAAPCIWPCAAENEAGRGQFVLSIRRHTVMVEGGVVGVVTGKVELQSMAAASREAPLSFSRTPKTAGSRLFRDSLHILDIWGHLVFIWRRKSGRELWDFYVADDAVERDGNLR